MPHEEKESDGGQFRVRNFLRTQLVNIAMSRRSSESLDFNSGKVFIEEKFSVRFLTTHSRKSMVIQVKCARVQFLPLFCHNLSLSTDSIDFPRPLYLNFKKFELSFRSVVISRTFDIARSLGSFKLDIKFGNRSPKNDFVLRRSVR